MNAVPDLIRALYGIPQDRMSGSSYAVKNSAGWIMRTRLGI
jgi:hypothetical protein